MRIPLFEASLSRLYLKLAWLVLAVACGLAAWIVTEHLSVPDVSSTVPIEETGGGASTVPAPLIDTEFDWAVFHSAGNISSEPEASGLASRFELVGTYFVYDRVMNNKIRKAIVDDHEIIGAQHIVGEKDTLAEGIVVRSIFRERIILRQGDKETELWLSFAGRGRGQDGSHADSDEEKENRFGARQLNDHRWILDRDALLDYYQELRDRPERLVQVFDSFDPLYNESGDIEGYKIGIEGEEELFDATGLQDGDIVREVNSLKMTSRRRAEFFIHEFAKDRANVFVLNLERDGKTQRMIYRVK